VIILNPVSGARQQRAALSKLQRRLRAVGVETEIRPTEAAGQARCLAAEAAKEADAVLAAGGDGTIREVCEGLVGTNVPLLVWPHGTENLVAKSLGFRAKADLIVSALQRGRCVDLDVGVANGRVFLVLSGCAFDAECTIRLARLRTGHITHLSYFWPIWRTFWEHKFPYLDITIDGNRFFEGHGMVFVGNMARYSIGLPVVRDARPDDGLLDVIVFPTRSRLKLLAHSIRAIFAAHIGRGGVAYQRGRSIRIDSPTPAAVQLDGDPAGTLPVDFEVRPKALRVMLPAIPPPKRTRIRWIGPLASQTQ
jgi:YegS/Rv2252/BmrU family lipid kinase